ncbi:MAG: hypothetical protein KC620_25010, partial [Myxococcales bacterium]|nr:hypothetical protein [Myxococcales bacterium]
MRPLHPIAALLAAFALGCAGRPTAPPALPGAPDHGDALPFGAPIVGVARPHALTKALTRLGSPLSLLMDGDRWMEAVGLDGSRPVWFAARLEPELALLRAADDATRLLTEDLRAAPPDTADTFAPLQINAWLNDNPLPAAFLHVRLAGEAPGPPARSLGDYFGALQSASLSDPPETVASVLGVPPEALAAAQPCLKRLAAARFHRLLTASAPTLLVAQPGGVIDVLVDQDVGEGALLAGLQALPECDETDIDGRIGARIAGPPTKAEVIRAHLDVAAWLRALRTAAAVSALRRLASDARPIALRARSFEEARKQGEIATRLVAPARGAFTELEATL